MISREVIGKRIVAIHQSPATSNTGDRVFDVESIELEDGTRLRPMTTETDYGEYLTEIFVTKPDRGRNRRRVKGQDGKG